MIEFIHPPFAFHTGEDRTKTFFERIDFGRPSCLAAVDQPGESQDRSSASDQGDSGDQPVEVRGFSLRQGCAKASVSSVCTPGKIEQLRRERIELPESPAEG